MKQMIRILRNRLRNFLSRKDDNNDKESHTFEEDTYSEAYAEVVDEIDDELNMENEMAVTLQEIEQRLDSRIPLTYEQCQLLNIVRLI